MEGLLDFLLGIKPTQWAGGGARRLEWLEMPKHDKLFLLLLVAAAATFGVMHLYRRENRNLSFPIRAMFATLRLLVLAGIVAILLEPVVVFTKTEYVPSTILVLRDASDSMSLKDAYASEPYAQRMSQVLSLPGGVKELRDSPRDKLVDRVLAGGLAKQ